MGNICGCFKSAPKKEVTIIPPKAPPLPPVKKKSKTPTPPVEEDSSQSTRTESLSSSSPSLSPGVTPPPSHGIPIRKTTSLKKPFNTGKEFTRPLPANHICYQGKRSLPLRLPFQHKIIEKISETNVAPSNQIVAATNQCCWLEESSENKDGNKVKVLYLGYSDPIVKEESTAVNQINPLPPQPPPPMVQPLIQPSIPILPKTDDISCPSTQILDRKSQKPLTFPTSDRPKIKKRHKANESSTQQRKRATGGIVSSENNRDLDFVMSPTHDLYAL